MSKCHTIQFDTDEAAGVCIIKSNEAGLETLRDMIDMKIKMKNNSHATLICKSYTGLEFKLRFELEDNK